MTLTSEEDARQRGNSGTALAGSVASALRLLAEEERHRLEQSYVSQAHHWQDQMTRHFRGIAASGLKLIDLIEDWPAGLTFPAAGDFPQALRQAKALIDRLAERIDA